MVFPGFYPKKGASAVAGAWGSVVLIDMLGPGKHASKLAKSHSKSIDKGDDSESESSSDEFKVFKSSKKRTLPAPTITNEESSSGEEEEKLQSVVLDYNQIMEQAKRPTISTGKRLPIQTQKVQKQKE